MTAASRSHRNAPAAHKLSTLLADFAEVAPACERQIYGLSLDSRTTRAGDLFFACASQGRLSVAGGRTPGATAGTRTDGHAYIDQASLAGAAAVVWELIPGHAHPDLPSDCSGRKGRIPMFGIEQLSQRVGVIAERFHDYPCRELSVIGITGTNGKTSISHLLAQVLSEDNKPACGVIGTLGYGPYGKLQPALNTTPDALTLHALLAEFRAAHMHHVTMEVSSHALVQGRVNGVSFDTAVFTNLTRDHLDYHADMNEYGLAKRRLFLMPGLRHAVINADDAYGHELISALPASVKPLCYGLTASAAGGVRGSELMLSPGGLRMKVRTPAGEGVLLSPLFGRFNASNLLAALSVLLALGKPLQESIERLAQAHPIPGRMERFGGGRKHPLVVVDYAHTPDALTQALQTLREHMPPDSRLWCIFGAGGDRDRGKRPLMGKAAQEHADFIVLTDDNPRHEDPVHIIADILGGMSNPDAAYIHRARAEAIAFVLHHTLPGDTVLIAGKGHEDYQHIGDEKIPFSDREQVLLLLKEMEQ
ncbi:MAG: UDP-N-acetylmuramoyl-L-alanyl-D-glutamate--2,6-diaminopimelate ligase [Proteobacteria bacterium]|nr:UDP-N-acetylmuramoyl-L-alanyl-D-glutamate--2,6-diaminopimelate ligase [Pseudomonadota bacterium]